MPAKCYTYTSPERCVSYSLFVDMTYKSVAVSSKEAPTTLWS